MNEKRTDWTQFVIDQLERDEDLLQYAEDKFVECGEKTNPNVMLDYFMDDIDCCLPYAPTIYKDMLKAFLQEVDWEKVANHVMNGMNPSKWISQLD